jgi:hypothetical protein
MTERAGSGFSLALVEGAEDQDAEEEMEPSTVGLWMAGTGGVTAGLLLAGAGSVTAGTRSGVFKGAADGEVSTAVGTDGGCKERGTGEIGSVIGT